MTQNGPGAIEEAVEAVLAAPPAAAAIPLTEIERDALETLFQLRAEVNRPLDLKVTRLARAIEARAGLPPGALDTNGTHHLNAEAWQIEANVSP